MLQDAQGAVASYQDKIADYLFEMACLKGLEDFAKKRSLPLRFLIYTEKLMDLCDQSNRFFQGVMRRQGLIIQCRRDCTYCCRNMPAGLSLVELLYFYHGMQESGSFPRLYRRCLEAGEWWAKAFQQCRSTESHDAHALPLPEKALRRYQEWGLPCRFSQGGSCQLYPYRPFACRMHFSLSPSSWCNPHHCQFSNAVIFNLEPSGRVAAALERIEHRLQIKLSEILACGILQLTINVMRFERIRWTQ
jgi:hypothetical protein